LKILGWTAVSIIVLVLLLLVLIQVPAVQNLARGRVVAYLKKKLGTKVRIDHLSVAFPKKIVLEGVYFEDQNKDTLLAGQRIAADLTMLKLIRSEVELNDIELRGIRANIYRKGTDTFFNYDYIIKAFTSPSATPNPADTTGINLNIKHVRLEKVLATFRDDNTGSDMYAYIGDFETNIRRFDVNHYRFDVPGLRLEHVIARAYQHKPLVEPKPVAEVVANNSTPPKTDLKLGKLTLRDISADYGNDVSALHATLRLGEMIAEPDKLDLPNLQIALRNFTLNNTDAVVTLGNTPQAHEVEKQVSVSAKAQVSNPWRLSLDKISLDNNNIRFDNNQRVRQPHGIDYAHLDVQHLTFDASHMIFSPAGYSGDIARFAFREQSGLDLQRLQTSFVYSEHGVQLKNLLLQTGKTFIRDDVEMGWPGITVDQLPSHIGDVLLRVNLANSRVALSDVLLFAPALASAPPFYHNEDAVFAINTRIQGKVSDLDIPVFEASGMTNTAIRMSGQVRGLPDPNRTIYNLTIDHFASSQSDLQKLAPIPATVRVPETIAASGTFFGSMQAFNTKLAMRSSRGDANVLAQMRNGNTYNIAAGVTNLDLGYILKQEKTYGRVSAKATAAGSGFDPATMVSTMKMNVFSAYVQGYNYQNLAVEARLDRGHINAAADMHDPNLTFRLDGSALMKGTYPAVQATLILDSVNLQALHLYSGDLRIHGRAAANLPSTNPDALLGTIDISDLIISNAGKRYALYDTTHIAATEAADGRHITIRSPALSAEIAGQYKLTEIATAVQHTINRYYRIPGFRDGRFAPENWTLNATLYPAPLLFSFLPEMKGSDSIKTSVSYNSNAEDLKLAIGAPKIIYGTSRVDSLTVRAATGNTLAYAISAHGISNPNFRVHHTSITGDIANNQATTAIDIRDAANTSQYQLGATLNQTSGNGFRVSLAPNLMLDYDRWNVGADNFVRYDDAGLIVHNLSLSSGAQTIAANSIAERPEAPIDIRFTNFEISTITKLANQDSALAGGVINGTAQLRNPTHDIVFTSDLTVNNLRYMRDSLGDLTLRVNNETDQTLAANIGLRGHGNDIHLDGRYFIASKGLDMNMNLNSVSLAMIRTFSAGQIADADGYLRGQLAVKGTLDKPDINGKVRFDSAHITPTLLGERFALTNDAINVNASGIHFNRFTIEDDAKNTANIDGDLLTTDYRNYRFALDVTADNFQAVNVTRGRGSNQRPFYGTLNLSTNTKIRGDMTLPVVTGYVRVNKNTDFSYVLPTNDPEVQSREGVVEFVDMSAAGDSTVFPASGDSVSRTGLRGMDVAARIETDSAAKFTIVIDDRNGDAVHIRGIAALEAGIDRSGKTSLTGTYVMQQGSYVLTFNFLRREFFVKPGSTITWDGDPMRARVDITAVYTANTAPIDLVAHQLSGRSQYEINQYKQRVPFNVLLNMKGSLQKPRISFDIVLPDREASRLQDVDAKLAQVRADETELNKQVFALLLLGRFVDENPLESNGSPSTAESFVRQSASRILTDQINRLAGNLIHGVDLTFGVNSGSDYSTGELTQRTDLTVGLSKRLMNDRLKVNVGSSFGVEGPTAPNQQASNIAGDVSVDYQLTKDGRYIIRAYRENNYEGMVDGQVIETGATFIYRIEYDKLNEFFSKPKKR
jgi:hypothetical protein